MKILISTETYYPNISGAAIFSHDIAQKMVEKGHKVFVIAPSPKFTEYEEEIDGIKIFRVASKMNRFRNGYYVSKFPYFKVSKIIEHIRPDVIHIQDPLFLATSSLIKARKLKIPVVVTHHFSLEYVLSYLPYLKFIHPFIARILGGYLNWIYGKCDVLTCPTKVIAKNFQMIQTGTKIEVISNGVDTSQFMPYYADADLIRKKWKIPFQKPVILYVGRLDIDKDMKTYIKSIPFVLEKLDAHFVVVGDGTERKNLEELAGNLGVKDHTTFINFIPHNDSLLPKIYQTASLFVNPCPCETLSVAVLEAEATGLPIVAANSGALKEVVGNNKNGLLFQPKNHQDLAKKIITILKNESLAKKMGEESLKKVNNHLVKHTYNKFENIYQTLTNK